LPVSWLRLIAVLKVGVAAWETISEKDANPLKQNRAITATLARTIFLIPIFALPITVDLRFSSRLHYITIRISKLDTPMFLSGSGEN